MLKKQWNTFYIDDNLNFHILSKLCESIQFCKNTATCNFERNKKNYTSLIIKEIINDPLLTYGLFDGLSVIPAIGNCNFKSKCVENYFNLIWQSGFHKNKYVYFRKDLKPVVEIRNSDGAIFGSPQKYILITGETT